MSGKQTLDGIDGEVDEGQSDRYDDDACDVKGPFDHERVGVALDSKIVSRIGLGRKKRHHNQRRNKC